MDSNLKPLPNALNKREPQNYLCHAWMSEERLVIGTDTGIYRVYPYVSYSP